MADGGAPRPDWYHDPERPGWLRWWTGSEWTDYWKQSAAPPRSAEATSGGETDHPPGTSSPASPPDPPHGPRRRALIAGTLALIGVGAIGAAAFVVFASASDDSTPGSDTSDETSDRTDDLFESCGEREPPSIPGTDITVPPVTLRQEIEFGRETRDLILSIYVESDDRAARHDLERLLDELRPDDDIPYAVTLLDDGEVNAFAAPGGDIYFTTGIVDAMNEDELAFVMAHEIAHIACRHLAQQFEREALAAAGLNAILGTDLDADDLYGDPAAAAVTSFLSLSFSRDDESESDLAALDLLEGSGRPLPAAVDALSILRDLEGADPDAVETLFSTHPPTGERINDLRAAIAER